MRLISNSADCKRYALDKDGDIVEFLLVKFPLYREGKSQQWKMVEIELIEKSIEGENSEFERRLAKINGIPDASSRAFKCNFVFDSKGRITRCILIDSKGIQRTREYYNDLNDISEQGMKSLGIRGLFYVEGRWIKDLISFPQSTDVYYYDAGTKEFVSPQGAKVVSQTVLTRFELPDKLEETGNRISKKFTELMAENKKELSQITLDDDISFFL